MSGTIFIFGHLFTAPLSSVNHYLVLCVYRKKTNKLGNKYLSFKPPHTLPLHLRGHENELLTPGVSPKVWTFVHLIHMCRHSAKKGQVPTLGHWQGSSQETPH